MKRTTIIATAVTVSSFPKLAPVTRICKPVDGISTLVDIGRVITRRNA